MTFRTIEKKAPEEDFSQVAELFLAMHEFMYTQGLSLKLTENGEQLWIKSIKNTLGRINFLAVAEENDTIVGFAQGMIRMSPDYLGNKKGGFVSFVYVDPPKRNGNVGNKLVELLENCFNERNVDFVELEVLQDNQGAIKFWQKNGYQTELLRMKKQG